MAYNITTHGDFKRYYDTTLKRNYWVLGYFGGGSVNIAGAMDLAKQYTDANNVPLDTVYIDEISKSIRYKYFKYIYSTEEQEQELNSIACDDVYKWLTD